MRKQHLSSEIRRSTLLGLSLVALVAGSSCATMALMDSDINESTRTVTTKQVLVEDRLVAFGRPAQALPNMPANSVVIVGEKNSYVLSQGGPEMVNILTNLTPENIKVDSDMVFYSRYNDGYFEGKMDMSYAKLKSDITPSEYQFFSQNGGTECSNSSDERMGTQRYCFSVPIKGGVFPVVSNLDIVRSEYKALTKPYSVSIYTENETETTTTNGVGSAAQLVLLPFAVAFDVVTMPFLILGIATS